MKNKIGQNFGELTVLSRVEDKVYPNGKKISQWLCLCSCGEKEIVSGSYLSKKQCCKKCANKKRSEATKQKNKKESNDKITQMIGKKFGDLTVVRRNETLKSTSIYLLCKCECGKETNATIKELINNEKTHCGCKNPSQHRYKDITGQKFGKLTALYPTKKNNRRAMMWMFQCDCGNIKEIEGNSVVRGNTWSCGCLKNSYGEFKIAELLKEANIAFEKEKFFFNYPSGGKALFDFYVENKYLIEFDGEQHFKTNHSWWNTPELVQQQQERDNIKNQWCKNNNIPLIRIPYTHLTKLQLQDLLLETTKFQI